MTPDQFKAIAEQGEGQRIEFKSTLAELEKVTHTLGAFLNSAGGSVFIGVKDDGSPSRKVTIGRNTLEELASQFSRRIAPEAYPVIEQFNIDTAAVIVVSVPQRRAGQVFYVDGRAWVRVGRTNRLLGPHEIRGRILEIVPSIEQIERTLAKRQRERLMRVGLL